jgi:hypothetical protein
MDDKKPKLESAPTPSPMVKIKFCANVTNTKGLDVVLIQVKKEKDGNVIHEWMVDIKED